MSGDVEIVLVQETATEIVSEGIQGPPGPPGNNLVGGYNVTLANLQPGDTLTFAGDKFVNTPVTSLTDGGNF